MNRAVSPVGCTPKAHSKAATEPARAGIRRSIPLLWGRPGYRATRRPWHAHRGHREGRWGILDSRRERGADGNGPRTPARGQPVRIAAPAAWPQYQGQRVHAAQLPTSSLDSRLYGTTDNVWIWGQCSCGASSGSFSRYQGRVEVPRLTLEMADLALTAFGLEVFDASLDIVFPAGEHGVDETSELARGGLLTARAESSRRSRARWHTPLKVRSWRGVGSGHAQRLPGAIGTLRRSPLTAFPPLMRVPRASVNHEQKCCAGGKRDRPAPIPEAIVDTVSTPMVGIAVRSTPNTARNTARNAGAACVRGSCGAYPAPRRHRPRARSS